MIKAKVAYLEAPYKLIYKEEMLNDELIASDSILCKTLVSAISPGTELAAYTGMAPLRPGNVYPRVVGYCNVSVVMECGESISAVKKGDRILTFSSHRSHFIISEAEVLSIIPENVSSASASTAYLYHLGYDAILKSAVCLGSPIVVVGLGVVGLGVVACAVQAGAEVYAISDQQAPSEIAIKIGAKQVFHRYDSSLLKEKMGVRLADVIVTTTNSWDDWYLCMELAGVNAFIAVLGFPGRGIDTIPNNPLDSQFFYSKQLRIQAVGMAPENNDSRQFLKFNEKNNLDFILKQIQCGAIDPRLIISGEWNSNKLEQAYQFLVSRQDSPLTYVLKWQDKEDE